jgi:hypothetical protein
LKATFLLGGTVPVPYEQRRQRRQQLAEKLPPGLRGRIALRNVEAVAQFSPETQQRLAESICRNVQIPAAIRFLKENPKATVAEIVEIAGKHRQAKKKDNQKSLERKNLTSFADLLQVCFPDMPRTTASAMAESEILSDVLDILCAQQVCFASKHVQSDLVVVVLCGLVRSTIERLNQIIAARTIYRQAIQQSGLTWPFTDDA